jgi:hypothetical protein
MPHSRSTTPDQFIFTITSSSLYQKKKEGGKMKSSQRLYKKCRLFRSCPQYHAPRRTVFYTVVNCDPVQGQGSSRRRRLRPVLRHLPAVALRPAALGLVAGVAAVPGGGRHGPARHRQLQRPLRRPGLRLRLRRAVLRRRVLLLRRRRPQPARVLVAAVRRRAPRVQPVFLQQGPEKIKRLLNGCRPRIVCTMYVAIPTKRRKKKMVQSLCVTLPAGGS